MKKEVVYKRVSKCGICGMDKLYIKKYNEILCGCSAVTPETDITKSCDWVQIDTGSLTL